MDDNTQTSASSPSSPNELKKRLKKQAKREARAMQSLDQARRDVEKAERKLTQAQQNLQKHQAQMQTCTEKLEKIRLSSVSSVPTSQNGIEPSRADSVSDMEEIVTGEAVQFFLAHEKTLADQPLFDANETIDLVEEEGPAGEELRVFDLPSPEEPAGEAALVVDLLPPGELAGEESTPVARAGQEGQAIQASQEVVPAEAQEEVDKQGSGAAPVPPRKPAARRPRTSATPRATTRQRGSSGRTKSSSTDET